MIRPFHLVALVAALSLFCPSLSVAQNDNFVERIDLDSVFSASDTGSNVGSTGELGEPPQSGVITSAWWQWTSPTNDVVTIEYCQQRYKPE